jgi:L-threonylcarbamoyladenylate synthase
MKEDIIQSVRVIAEGGIILYPTDTVWGIGCDATNEKAVQKIFNLKKREDSKSMLILLDAPSRLPEFVFVPDIAWNLIEVSNTPLTIIFPDAKKLARGLIAPDGSTGIRITADNFCRQIIRKSGKPLVSTSANISGSAAPSLFSEISEEIKSSVDYVVKWRQHENLRGKPSSIIKLEKNGTFKIIRG